MLLDEREGAPIITPWNNAMEQYDDTTWWHNNNTTNISNNVCQLCCQLCCQFGGSYGWQMLTVDSWQFCMGEKIQYLYSTIYTTSLCTTLQYYTLQHYVLHYSIIHYIIMYYSTIHYIVTFGGIWSMSTFYRWLHHLGAISKGLSWHFNNPTLLH